MCGIAGIIDPALGRAEGGACLEAMLERIRHRGPDGEGQHLADGLAVGMRRLSIIDLAGGAQPIWNEDRTIGVVFNGEIYNYREIRAALGRHTFRTASDTEVLVHAYEEFGTAMLEKLRGMFAFALLDGRRRQVVIARDHFGQKPLYYCQHGSRLAFGSELKSLLALPGVSREINEAAFLDYAIWLSLPPPQTHLRHIHKLPAGSMLTVPLNDPAAARLTRYWHYDLATPASVDDLETAAAQLDAALHESLDLHLRADVPVGVLLSSGLDSRCVAAYAQEIQGGRLSTFTVGFTGAGGDSELDGAAATAAEIQSEHFALALEPHDLAENLPRIAWHLDEPIGDPAAFAVLKVCELAHGHVKVLLSGEGADELFAGYEDRYGGMMHTMARSDPWRPFARWLPAGGSNSKLGRLFARAHSSAAEEAITLREEGFPGDVRQPRGLTAAQMKQRQIRTAEIARALHRPQRDRLSELLVVDIAWQLAESLLQKADKMSMAASIELRTPLLDVGIAGLAAQFSSNLKLPPGGPGKLVLRQTLARRIPEMMTRPKMGFPVPLQTWFAGPLREQVEAEIFAADAQCRARLDPDLLRAAWEDTLAGTWDGARLFYALWLYEAWYRCVVRSS